jgi:transposase
MRARPAAFDSEFVQMARKDESTCRLTTIPGIGVINATALVAAVGNAQHFGAVVGLLNESPIALGHSNYQLIPMERR